MDTPKTPSKKNPVVTPAAQGPTQAQPGGQRLKKQRSSDQAAPARVPAEPNSPDGSVVDRRMWPDRRENMAVHQDGYSGLERRRGVGRRLSDFTRSAEEGELTKEQFLFLMAIEAFKNANDRQFPTWMDVLEVVRLLGYRKTMSSELNLRNTEDWREVADAAANVRPQRWHERAVKAHKDAGLSPPAPNRDAA